jgi:Rieske Fe-S protein
MPRCELCGNDYEKTFAVISEGKAHNFDSFECAIQLLAPSCAHCGCRIIGHGLDEGGVFFCCAHCARSAADGEAGHRAA